MSSTIYSVKPEEIQRCFEFAVRYHLDPSKGKAGRTSGASRGLGEVIDAFLGGKLVEIAATGMLKEHNPAKEYILNFDLVNTASIRLEPDIKGIIESGRERNPNAYVEIKRISSGDRWIGLTEEQFASIKKAQSDPSKIYIFGIELGVLGNFNGKQTDLLGAFLKATGLSGFDGFCRLDQCFAKPAFIITGEELEEHGKRYQKNGYIFETEIFEQVPPITKSQICKKNPKYIKIADITNSNLAPYSMTETITTEDGNTIQSPIPAFFFPIKITGNALLFEKRNPMSTRRYIYCLSPVKAESDVLGRFLLKEGEVYLFNVKTKGRNPILARNNLWIAKNKLATLIKDGIIPDPCTRIVEIANII